MASDAGASASKARNPRSLSFRGDATAVALVLSRYADRPAFVDYGEDASQPPVPRKCQAHAELVNELRELSPTLNFSQSLLEQSLQQVAESKGFSFGTDAVRADYLQSVARRLRCLMRHVRQTEIKSPRAAWLRVFTRPSGFDAQSAGGDEEGTQEDYNVLDKTTLDLSSFSDFLMIATMVAIS